MLLRKIKWTRIYNAWNSAWLTVSPQDVTTIFTDEKCKARSHFVYTGSLWIIMLSSSSGHSTITHQHTTAACIPVRAISYWHQYFRLTAIDISVKPTARLGGVSWASMRTGYILHRIDILGLANLHVANNSKDENGSTPRADQKLPTPQSQNLHSQFCALVLCSMRAVPPPQPEAPELHGCWEE